MYEKRREEIYAAHIKLTIKLNWFERTPHSSSFLSVSLALSFFLSFFLSLSFSFFLSLSTHKTYLHSNDVLSLKENPIVKFLNPVAQKTNKIAEILLYLALCKRIVYL